MSLRELLLAVALVAGLALVVFGVSLWLLPLAFVVGGLGVAGLGVLFFTEVG